MYITAKDSFIPSPKDIRKERSLVGRANRMGLAVLGSLVFLVPSAGIQWWIAECAFAQSENAENQRVPAGTPSSTDRPTQASSQVVAGQPDALESRLKQAEEKAQFAEKRADLAASQLSALEVQLKKSEERAQLAEEGSDLGA